MEDNFLAPAPPPPDDFLAPAPSVQYSFFVAGLRMEEIKDAFLAHVERGEMFLFAPVPPVKVGFLAPAPSGKGDCLAPVLPVEDVFFHLLQ